MFRKKCKCKTNKDREVSMKKQELIDIYNYTFEVTFLNKFNQKDKIIKVMEFSTEDYSWMGFHDEEEIVDLFLNMKCREGYGGECKSIEISGIYHCTETYIPQKVRVISKEKEQKLV